MVDPVRRQILKAGASAAALAAAAPQVFGGQGGPGGAGESGKAYQRGAVRIRDDESGSGAS